MTRTVHARGAGNAWFSPTTNNKYNMNLKKLALLTALVLATAAPAGALTFNYGDVLLIFRAKGYNNVEFDLGNISQFLNRPNGYQATVANWSADIVNGQFALTNGIAQFFVLATTDDGADGVTNPTAWISDNQPLVAAVDDGTTQWERGLFNIIGSVGFAANNDPSAPVGTNYDVVETTSLYAFDFITSNNNQTPNEIPYLGGSSNLKFSSAGSIPGTVLFYAIQPSSSTPKPPATLIGSFSLAANATLTFQAGPLVDSTRVLSVTNSAGTVAVTFSTKSAVKYRLRYSTQLTGRPETWTILPQAVAGDGNPQTLQDNAPTDAARFYAVESYQ